MCVAMPGLVVAVSGAVAHVDFNGNIIIARADLVSVKPGDLVLVHAGLIIQKLNATEADELNRIFADLNEVAREHHDPNC